MRRRVVKAQCPGWRDAEKRKRCREEEVMQRRGRDTGGGPDAKRRKRCREEDETLTRRQKEDKTLRAVSERMKDKKKINRRLTEDDLRL
jgi:hypothetical protein